MVVMVTSSDTPPTTSSSFSTSSCSPDQGHSTDTPPCSICGQLSHGNHFGVISCRACAAFFRRSADSKWSKMECLSRHCDGKTYHCKPCRLKRCRDVGMDTSKFQHDRDALMTYSRKRKFETPPRTMESLIGRPHYVLFSSSITFSPKTFVDLKFLVEKAIDILRAGPAAPFQAETQLKRLGFGSNCMKLSPQMRRMDVITQTEIMEFWEFHFLSVAHWLINFQTFQQLDEELKLKILFAIWHVWGRLDKLMATALYRKRNQAAKPTERVVGNGIVTDMGSVNADTEWMSPYPVEQLGYFLDGIRVYDLFPMIDELKEMNLSETELNFMLAQLCFQYAEQRFGGSNETQIVELMEQFQAGLSDDLHVYYTTELGVQRYSARLAKMLRINKLILENIRKHRARGEIAKVFDVFRLDFSHPDMFRDTGFI